ncbi:prolactin-releasing peptide receptor-like [Lineus longissimus]|uniref:prolactin-releasing peptide receptor-like n=1 Tax=Lineus longissimus TaxID=88925 RepID=UPI002B4DCE64
MNYTPGPNSTEVSGTFLPTELPAANITKNITEPHEPVGEWIKAMTIPFYVVIFVVGVTGNSLVVFVVARNKAMQTITNIFITNLGCADIMMCLLAVPFTPLAAFLDDWPFGEVMCQIIPMSLAVSVFVSTLTSTAIAIDRYFVIVYPFKPRMKAWLCLLLIISIWIISCSVSLPLAIYRRITVDNGDRQCGEDWPDINSRKFCIITLFFLQYVVPCCVITFCYWRVSGVLRMRAKAKIGSGNKSREKEEMEIRRKRRTNRMLIAMVAIFVGCWMPLNVVLLTQEAHPRIETWQWLKLIFFIAHIIAMSSAIYNPFLYAWMNENFRKEFKQVLPFLFSGHTHSKLNGSMTQYSTVDTTHTVVDRSPMRERNGSNVGTGKTTQAHYDVDSEKVHLKVAEDGDEPREEV